MLSYETIFSQFHNKITDYNLTSLPDEDIYDMETGWLKSAVSLPIVRTMLSSAVFDDEERTMTYKLSLESDSEASNDMFVSDMLATGMVTEWLKPQLMSTINTSQVFGTGEEKFYAQANHLNSVKDLYNQARYDLDKLIKDFGTYNSTYSTGSSG